MREFQHLQFRWGRSGSSVSFARADLWVRIYKAFRPIVALGVLLFFLQFSVVLGQRWMLNQEVLRQSSLVETSEILSQQASQLEQETNQVYAKANNLRLKYGWNKKLGAPLELGVGGPVNRDSLFGEMVNPLKLDVRSLDRRLTVLSRQLENGKENFRNMNRFLDKEVDDLKFIPSINPTSGYFASPFGMRMHPVLHRRILHAGMDIANKPWTPIYAPADGVVVTAKYGPAFGNYIAIDHGNGIETKYGHMNRYVVTLGETVHRGELIGYMGKTGRVTGPHLHYELHVNGTPVNPRPWLLPDSYSVD